MSPVCRSAFTLHLKCLSGGPFFQTRQKKALNADPPCNASKMCQITEVYITVTKVCYRMTLAGVVSIALLRGYRSEEMLEVEDRFAIIASIITLR